MRKLKISPFTVSDSFHPVKIQKKFLSLFTLYKRYRNDTGRPKDKRTITPLASPVPFVFSVQSV